MGREELCREFHWRDLKTSMSSGILPIWEIRVRGDIQLKERKDLGEIPVLARLKSSN